MLRKHTVFRVLSSLADSSSLSLGPSRFHIDTNAHVQAGVPSQHGTDPTNAAEGPVQSGEPGPPWLAARGAPRLGCVPWSYSACIQHLPKSLVSCDKQSRCFAAFTLLTPGHCLHESHSSPAQPAKDAPSRKCVRLIAGNTALPNHCHMHLCLVFRREDEMRVVICYPGWPRADTPHSTRIQNAISGYVMVFCYARLISPCWDQGYNAGPVSTLPRLFILYKDQKAHREWTRIPWNAPIL